MNFLEPLYRPGGIVRELSLLNQRVASAATAASSTMDITNPEANYVWFVTNIAAVATPGGAEFIQRLALRLVTPADDAAVVLYDISSDEVVGAAASLKSHSWQGEIIVLPGWTIRCNVIKSAAVVAISGILSVLGYQAPVGNIVR